MIVHCDLCQFKPCVRLLRYPHFTMANSHRAPKQWSLTKSETISSFEAWRQNLHYTLSLDPNFAPILAPECSWLKSSKTAPKRGLTDDPSTDSDGADIPAGQRRTAAQKAAHLELMLGQIANFCPIIARNTIVKNSVSIDSIWQAIRLHFGFQTTGAHFLDFCQIKLQPGDRYEDLFQQLMAFTDDNLLKKNGGITHHGSKPDDDEEMTPSLENFIVLTWLRLIHEDLPCLVKQRYGTELRSRTLASIKPEISQALDSLLNEVRSASEARVMRAGTPENFSHQPQSMSFPDVSRTHVKVKSPPPPPPPPSPHQDLPSV